MTSQFPPTLRSMNKPDSERREVKKSIWTRSLCPDLCCSYSSLIVSAAGVVCVFFALLKRSDWSLQGNSWWIKITRKIITIIPHLLIWLLVLSLIIPWKINTLILFYMRLVNELVRKQSVFLLFLSLTQRRRAAGGRLCLYTVIKFHYVVFLTSGTSTHLFWPKELLFLILHNTD